MDKIYQQIDHNFRNLTKLVSQFLVNYTILYWIYKFILETKLENALEKKRSAATTSGLIAQRGMAAHAAWRPSTAQGRGRPRTLAVLQKSPRAFRD